MTPIHWIIWGSTISMAVVMLLFLAWLILRASENKDRKKVEREPVPTLRDDPDRERRQDTRRQRLERIASRPVTDRDYFPFRAILGADRGDRPGYEQEASYVQGPGYQDFGAASVGAIFKAAQKAAQDHKEAVRRQQARTHQQLHMTTFTTTPPPPTEEAQVMEYDHTKQAVKVVVGGKQGWIKKQDLENDPLAGTENQWISDEVEVLEVIKTRTGPTTMIRCKSGVVTTIQGDYGPPGMRVCPVQRWMLEKST